MIYQAFERYLNESTDSNLHTKLDVCFFM